MKIKISGRVQGVGFRFWIRGKMRELGIEGEVWNNTDGTVEVEFQSKSVGSVPTRKLIGMLKQGPPLARVTKVTIIKS